MSQNSDLEARLALIFRLILELPEDADVSRIRRINERRWDSLATVTLTTALEGEFAVTLDSQDISRLTSYQAVLLFLKERTL